MHAFLESLLMSAGLLPHGPRMLDRLIQARADMRVAVRDRDRGISAMGGVVPWHEWATPDDPKRPVGTVCGRRYSNGEFSYFETKIAALAAIGKFEQKDHWPCEIQEVTGFVRMKGAFVQIRDMDLLATQSNPHLAIFISETQLQELLDGKRLHPLREQASFSFVRYLWDGRTFLMNDEVALDFAQARYIAAHHNRLVPLRGQLFLHSLDDGAVNTLRQSFDMYAMNADRELVEHFHAAMAAHKATYLWHPMPHPYEEARVIFLPKLEQRAMQVSRVLREAGLVEIGEHLNFLCAKQMTVTAQQSKVYRA